MYKKYISIILLIAFLVNSSSYGQDLLQSNYKCLAPSSIFQESFPKEDSSKFTESPLSDLRLLAVSFSIATHFLIDNKTKQTLPKIIRDEFRNNKEFLEGIALEDVYRKNNIVYIPYERNDKKYEIRTCLRNEFESIDKANSEWGVSKNFGIQIVKEVLDPIAQKTIVSASLLSVPNPSDFASKAVEAIKSGANSVHFDVAEGNKGRTAILEDDSIDTTKIFTPARLQEIKQYGLKQNLYIPIDVHFLIMEPSEDYLKSFIDAGADILCLHWESFQDKSILLKRLKFIKDNGAKAGITLRPDVDIKEVGRFITTPAKGCVDMISQAGIYPCYEGQVFCYDVLKNVRTLKKDFGFKGLLAVDGGIETEISSKRALEAGANFLVAGSAFFGNGLRSQEGMRIAAKEIRDHSPIEIGSMYDIIADRIIELRKKKKGKLWVRIDGYHGSGKTEMVKRLIQIIQSKNRNQSIIDFAQDNLWTDREEREERKKSDPTYRDGLTHVRIRQLNKAIHIMEEATGPVTFDYLYDFDSGGIDLKNTFDVREDSIIFSDGCYASLADKKDFDLRIFIKTDQNKAKERAMVRDAVKVHRDPKDTQSLYEDVYEPTYERYLNEYRPEENADVVIDTKDIENPRIVKGDPIIKLLECTSCSRQLPSTTRITRCPFCGGNLEFDIKGDVDFESLIDRDTDSMWRYRKIMPVDEEFIVSAGEGNTPVIYLEELSKKLGIELYAKLETENPTGTFKDREASFVISRSKQLGQNDVVMQSTGNTGLAITYYAGLAKLRSYFFGPFVSAYKMLIPNKSEDTKVVLVDGAPIDVKSAATDFALVHNFPKISPFCERCEANSTQGYEIAEQILKGKLPNFDFYVQPMAAGMGPIGFFSGMNRVSEWTKGKVKFPRILAVQISEFAPCQKAWDQDKEQVGPEGLTPRFATEHPFEPTLHTTNAPAYYPYLRQLLKRTDGILIQETPDEVKQHMQEFIDALKKHGVELSETERSAFVGYAGLVQQIEKGVIPKDSKVIIMVTGKGKKEYEKVQPDAVIPPGYDPEKLLNDLQASEDIKQNKLLIELIEKEKIEIVADDGEVFYFELAKKGRYGKGCFSIDVYNKYRKAVGYIDVRANKIDFSFDREYLVALYVEPIYRQKYQHIGQSLIALAMGISSQKGFDKFYADDVASEDLPFYRKMGFKIIKKDQLAIDLERDLTKEPLPQVGIKTLSKLTEENMNRIHDINMDLLPPVENGKTLWHVIPLELLPHEVDANFASLVYTMNQKYPDLREKIKVVTGKMDLITEVSKLAQNPNNIVDVALSKKKDITKLPEGVKALLFEGDLGTFRHLEGILAALRALQNPDTRYAAEKLLELHSFIAQNEIKGTIETISKNLDNPKELLKYISFNLKPISLSSEDSDRLNTNLLKLIQSA